MYESFLIAYLALNFFELLADELDNIAAFKADQVVVARLTKRLLVPGMVLSESVAGDESAVD